MNRRNLAPLMLIAVAHCATEDAEMSVTNDIDEVSQAQQELDAPEGCSSIYAIIRPIAAPHFHDPQLQQTAGAMTIAVDGTEVRTGTSIATIVGQSDQGVPLGNHDWLFADAGLRTMNDLLQLAPTDDPCLFDVDSEVYVVEGTGAYAGLAGTVRGSGYVNFCGAPGRVDISGALCPAN